MAQISKRKQMLLKHPTGATPLFISIKSWRLLILFCVPSLSRAKKTKQTHNPFDANFHEKWGGKHFWGFPKWLGDERDQVVPEKGAG